MNFYKHHLGDYAAGTSHLSWDEDCAYRRLIDQYYKREAPIPVEIKEAFRLARASSPSQRRAVEAVLREFFVLQADGWHQKRCDGEIVAANAQAETNRRISEEREAKRRERKVHESSHESLIVSLDGSCTNRSPVSVGEREPPQTPDSRLQSINTSGTTYPHPPAVRLNGSHSAGLPGIEARKPTPERLPDCPHSVIVGLYAKHLPQLRQPKVWTGARAEAMRARWRQGAMPSAFGSGYIDVDGGMRFWDRFFAFVATCPKLVNGIARPDQSRWEPDLPWLMKAENFAKVIEGNYAP